MGHTPGPWREDPTDIDPGGGKFDTRYYGYTRIRGEDNDLVVGDIDVSTPEGEANLRLILLAPKMLQALLDCRIHIEMAERCYDEVTPEGEELREIIRQATGGE